MFEFLSFLDTDMAHLVEILPPGKWGQYSYLLNTWLSKGPGGCLNVKMPSYQYSDPHVKDYKNPLHLDVVDRYLRRMGDKTIPDEAPPSLESFYPP